MEYTLFILILSPSVSLLLNNYHYRVILLWYKYPKSQIWVALMVLQAPLRASVNTFL